MPYDQRVQRRIRLRGLVAQLPAVYRERFAVWCAAERIDTDTADMPDLDRAVAQHGALMDAWTEDRYRNRWRNAS